MFMKAFTAQTYALMRIVTGFLFLWHGTQKLFGIPAAFPFTPPFHIQYIAGPIELVGGALIMIGLFTRWTAFLCSGLMAAAYWMAHGNKMFGDLTQMFPLLNGGELAALYAFIFLFISAYGSGIWSADAARGSD
jgi:putative oxidoreductase